jgi:CheY-like chemotaxis protein
MKKSVRDVYWELYEQVPVPLLALDPRGTVRYINRAGAELLGTVRSNILDNPFRTFVAVEDRPQVISHLLECRDAGARKFKVKVMLRQQPAPFQVSFRYAHGPAGPLVHTALIDMRESASMLSQELDTPRKPILAGTLAPESDPSNSTEIEDGTMDLAQQPMAPHALPIECAAAVGESTTPPPGTMPRGVKLLLIEDHRDTAEMLSELVRIAGYEVVVADSMASCLALDRRNVDIIVSDLGLPDGTGIELIQRLHAERRIPAIALTGHGRKDDVEAAKRAGFDVHLTKPIDMMALLEAIRRLSHQSRSLATKP